MKISYKWLKEYVDINVTPEKLAELLTMHSFEVENIIYQGEGLDGVVVGEVLEIKKHPNADKLSIAKVDVGEEEPRQIIFGQMAKMEIGLKVPVALAPTVLPGNKKIEKSKLRGKLSEGMLCLDQEIGLLKEGVSITFFDKDVKNGTPIKKALNLDDVIFEIDILPNRAHDCLSHIGVAREIAVLLNEKRKTKNEKLVIKSLKSSELLSVKIENKELCRRYSAVVINDIEIKESPQWLKSRLENCDIRSINNIVDITNFVMLSLGQPMHAFNADKLNGKIIVRNARMGEKILVLDEKEYKLNENDLVIADENRPIAIAGVMGGKETAVDENTKNIIFESANFQGAGIRKTSQRLKLASESSYRFEREIDPELTTQAIEMAVKLAGDLANGKAEKGIIDIYPNPVKPKEIEFDFSRVENLLGIKIEKEKAIKILQSLEFIVSEKGENIKIKVPTYRIDMKKINDVIEEIGRIHGYKNIPEIAPEIKIKSVISNKSLILEKDIREISEGLGWSEVYNYSFVSEKDINSIKLDIKNHFELENPLSEEYQFMRTSLLSGLLKNAGLNLKYKNSFELFELGRIYLKSNSKLPDEQKVLAGIIINKEEKNTLFYKAKGQLQVLFDKLGVEIDYQEIKKTDSFWHRSRSAEILYGSKLIGRVGEIHPIVSNSFDIEERILYFEIYQNELVKYYNQEKTYKQINRFPSVGLDLSIVFDEDVKWDDVRKVVFKAGGKLIKSIEPFDIYRGKKLGDGKKSIAFRISYQAEDRTLKDEEVGVVQDKVVRELGKLGGEIRA